MSAGGDHTPRGTALGRAIPVGTSARDVAPRGVVEYQPALDGMRGMAVSAVLLFHAGLGWMSGGYLGVSAFFTLSGFLITTLLIAEHDNAGRIDIARFYTRRAKRLLPASLFWVAVVAVLAAAGAFEGVLSIRRDIVAAVTQSFNWVKLASGESYAELNAAAAGVRRPLDHFWSLAVEQQFYWLWPLAFVGLVRFARGDRARLERALVVVAAMGSVAAPLIAWTWGPDAAYFATPARLAEILIGAALAGLLLGRTPPMSWWVLAPGGGIVLLAACVLLPDGSGPAYQGWLPVAALASAAVILGLQVDRAPRRLLSTRPLVALGRVSYSVYIVHWPVYIIIDRQNWSLPGVADVALKWTVTGVLAAASYHYIETPLRSARWLSPNRMFIGATTAAAMVAGLALVVPASAAYYEIDADTANEAAIAPAESLASLVPRSTAAPNPTPSTDVTTTTELRPARPVRILLVGDSTATALGAGLVEWAAAHPDLAQVSVEPGSGCGLLPGIVKVFGEDRDLGSDCAPYLRDVVPNKVRELQPDIVAVIETAWDVQNRRLVADGPVLSPLDAPIADMMSTTYQTFTADLLALGASRVVWLVPPMPLPLANAPDPMPDREARYAVQFAVFEDILRTQTGARLIDLRTWMETRGLLDSFDERPDGTHFTLEVATLTAEEFLGRELVRLAIT